MPPSRPPKEEELLARYFKPWFAFLESWVRRVLAESLSGDIHQEESRILSPISEFRQARGIEAHAGVPGMASRTMAFQPYTSLLVASSIFPVARILGLAAIDSPPPTPDVDIWDYRVRGLWRVTDLKAWLGKLERELDILSGQLAQATPAEHEELDTLHLEKGLEIATTTNFLEEIFANVAGEFVEFYALKVGVSASKHSLFAGPAALSAAFDGPGLARAPGVSALDIGVAKLSWTLRQRARVIVNEEIPMAAALGRDPDNGSGRFPEMLNPIHPDTDVNTALIPAGSPDDPGAAGTAVFFDRHAESGVDYRYGVSEVDPFGRWSRFTENTFRWEFDVPPTVPVQISATLDQNVNPALLDLTVTFRWPTDLFPAADYNFALYLRRQAPPSGDPHNRSHWQHFGRLADAGSNPFSFAGDFSGNTAHDGLAVSVSFSAETDLDPVSGDRQYRTYVLTFAGLAVTRDAVDRARVWIGIATRDVLHGIDSADVGGPALAEHILSLPPESPELPPDPEQATFADAEGQSTYTVQWTGTPNVRYVIYRAGERDLITLLQDRGVNTSVYDPEAAANFRAAALKQLAPLAHDAFQPRSNLVPEPPRYPPDFVPEGLRGEFLEPQDWENTALGGGPLAGGPRAFSDNLPGKLRTLTVYAVLGRSRSGILSAWPANASGFVVVEVPHAPEPTRPTILRASWQPPLDPLPVPPELGGARIELLIAQPPAESATVTAYEVYRTLDPARSRDFRLMRPLHHLEAPVYAADIPGLNRTPAATYVDPTVVPWRTYYYAVVGRAPSLNGGSLGMRSEASAPRKVVTMSADPPLPATQIVVLREQAEVRVTFAAEAPSTSAGDFILELIHLAENGPLIRHRETAVRARLENDPQRYEMTLPGNVLPDGEEIVVRITDPLGRSTDSGPVSASSPPDLDQLQANRFGNFLRAEVRSSAPITQPPTGAYNLQLFGQRQVDPANTLPREPILLAEELLHEIRTSGPPSRFQRSGPDGNGRHIYRIRINISQPFIRVIVRLTDPNGLQTSLRQNI